MAPRCCRSIHPTRASRPRRRRPPPRRPRHAAGDAAARHTGVDPASTTADPRAHGDAHHGGSGGAPRFPPRRPDTDRSQTQPLTSCRYQSLRLVLRSAVAPHPDLCFADLPDRAPPVLVNGLLRRSTINPAVSGLYCCSSAELSGVKSKVQPGAVSTYS